MSGFEQLGVQSWLSKQCGYMALHEPTPIQQQCIPAVLAGDHVVGGAATGSGKTAAFALPILQALSADVYGVFALVMTPSRELAYQIMDQFIALGAPLRVRTMLAIGGVRHEDQVDALKTRPAIVVATPGRLLHLLRTFQAEARPAFNHLRFLVLDEADRLTEDDISHSVRELLGVLPPTPRRQVLLFTATLEPRLISSTAADTGADGADGAETQWLRLLGIISEPAAAAGKRLTVCNLAGRSRGHDRAAGKQETAEDSHSDKDGDGDGDGEAQAAQPPTAAASLDSVDFPRTLRQTYVFIPDMVKLPNLVAALRAQGKEQSTIVFANSCLRVELVRLTLQLLGFPVCSLDSLLTQQHRLDNLALFKLGIARILVATDIAARGLDIPVVGTVIHYDFPKHATTYVHRVGRTARAGREGLTVALVTEHDVELVQRMERKLRISLTLWNEKALGEEKVLKILDEVSAAKVQAKQQVTEQFGNRAFTLKAQATTKKEETRSLQARTRPAPRKRNEDTGSVEHSPARRAVKRGHGTDDAPTTRKKTKTERS